MTVPKRGYRFGLPICSTSSTTDSSVASKIAESKPGAYAHIMEAQRRANTGTFEGLHQAVALLKSACEADPGSAVACSAIADCVMFQGLRGHILPAEAFEVGVASSERALRIDSELASAHAVRGWFYCAADDMEEGFSSLETALSLDPGYARATMYLSFAQRAAGMRRESLATARRAVELDPYAILHRRGLAWRLFCSGGPEEALEIERSMMREYPEDAEAHVCFGMYAAFLGAHDEALEASRHAAQMSGRNPGIMSLHTYVLACAGEHEKARRLADGLLNDELPRAPRSLLAMTYVPLGDHDRALHLLGQAREEKCLWFRGARFDPRLGELAHDPRLLALYADLG